MRHLRTLFERLTAYGILVNPAKCHFGAPSVRFLGYTVSKAGTRPLPEKVEAIRAYPRPTTAKQLRQFLGMINFYRRFFPRAATLQAPLNELLQGNVKGSAKIPWPQEAEAAFDACKEGLAQATLLAHPDPGALLAIISDASDTSIGAALQQRVHGNWQPLAFFSKKLSPAQKKYGAYDRELLAVYLAVKHFRHMVEGRTFIIFTDHKPLIFAFRQKPEHCSPRQFRYLDFISQFSTDIRHISGQENVVADALSRVDAISTPTVDFHQLALDQANDEEMQTYLRPGSSLQLQRIRLPDQDVAIYCDISTKIPRPFITKSFRRAAFDSVHGLAHPGVKATTRLVKQRFVWPGVDADCREWARSCLQCQRSKVSRHTAAPVGAFQPPSARFEHVHLDIIGPLPISEGQRYCLTCIDRFTRWPEVFPIANIDAETIARTFYGGWIARFGTPLRITTDQGRQFESTLFNQLASLTGSKHLRTTAYHPQANGMVERFHRHLKGAIRCHQGQRWTEVLPSVLLGIRAAWRDDLQASAAELVYGETIRLPGEFLTPLITPRVDPAGFVQQLRQQFRELQPTAGTNHSRQHPFIYKDLANTQQVFLRRDEAKPPLEQPYEGPYQVIRRGSKTFDILKKGNKVTVTIDRLKPAFILPEDVGNTPDEMQPTPHHVHDGLLTKSSRSEARQVHFDDDDRPGTCLYTKIADPPPVTPTITRSGRIIRPPQRYC